MTDLGIIVMEEWQGPRSGNSHITASVLKKKRESSSTLVPT